MKVNNNIKYLKKVQNNIKVLKKYLVHNVKFNCVPRDLKMATHILVKWSLNNCIATHILVLGSAPSVFVDIIILEQNLNVDM